MWERGYVSEVATEEYETMTTTDTTETKYKYDYGDAYEEDIFAAARALFAAVECHLRDTISTSH